LGALEAAGAVDCLAIIDFPVSFSKIASFGWFSLGPDAYLEFPEAQNRWLGESETGKTAAKRTQTTLRTGTKTSPAKIGAASAASGDAKCLVIGHSQNLKDNCAKIR
jgi:hypothetical protein